MRCFKIILNGIIVGLALFAGGFLYAADQSGEASQTPWSGWWWPNTAGGLVTGAGYKGHPAPLEKYDLITTNVQQGPASQFYLANNYDPDAENWSGLCDAWSAAAILEPIDFVPSTVNNLLFRIGDKKGLLTLSYELSIMTDFYDSVDSPLILHNWLQTYIGQQNKAFYAELDPSYQAWNYPIYKYEMNISDFGDEEYVTCTIWYADDDVHPDYNGTKELSKTYYYTLLKSGTGYIGSSWGMQNEYDHPSRVILPQSANARNPYLDYSTVKEIAESRDDIIESDTLVAINPGMYNLILLNPDQYLLSVDAGETARISMECIDDTGENIQVKITDGTGDLVFQGDFSETFTKNIDSGTPPYKLVLSKESYDQPGIYTLSYDITRGYEFVRPNSQKGYGWGGYALLNNTGHSIEGITVSGYASDGSPVDTFLGPVTLAPGEKIVVLSDEFPFRNQLEKQDYYGIKIHSPEKISILNLSGEYEKHMASFQGDTYLTQLVIPQCPNLSDFNTMTTFGIYNPGMAVSSVSFSLYSRTGELVERANAEFSPKEMKHFTNQSLPFDSTVEDGWILVESDTPIGSYEGWVSRRGDASDMIRALGSGTRFFLPNPVSDALWTTQLTLLNISESVNQVSCSLLNSSNSIETVQLSLVSHEKLQIDLAELFSSASGATISQSILEINASGPISGYYTYSTSVAADTISLPLDTGSDITSSCYIPHVASNKDWWTGITLCNVGASDSTVRFTPFDSQGNQLTDENLAITIKQNMKRNFLVSEILSKTVISNTAYIRIEVVQGSLIFGTYGYGSNDMSMLTGIMLQ